MSQTIEEILLEIHQDFAEIRKVIEELRIAIIEAIKEESK